MTAPQLLAGMSLVVILVSMASYFAWTQTKLLLSLDNNLDMRDDERLYLRKQSRRRLIGSGIMVLFAGLLLGSFTLEGAASKLAAKGEAAIELGVKAEFSPEEKRFRDLYSWYWIVCLLVLLALLAMAALDFFAIWNYGARSFKRLQDDRRDMIARQIARMRGQGNGRH